jgi:hypothetical protein
MEGVAMSPSDAERKKAIFDKLAKTLEICDLDSLLADKCNFCIHLWIKGEAKVQTKDGEFGIFDVEVHVEKEKVKSGYHHI